MSDGGQYYRNMQHVLTRLMTFFVVDSSTYVNFKKEIHFRQNQSMVTDHIFTELWSLDNLTVQVLQMEPHDSSQC